MKWTANQVLGLIIVFSASLSILVLVSGTMAAVVLGKVDLAESLGKVVLGTSLTGTAGLVWMIRSLIVTTLKFVGTSSFVSKELTNTITKERPIKKTDYPDVFCDDEERVLKAEECETAAENLDDHFGEAPPFEPEFVESSGVFMRTDPEPRKNSSMWGISSLVSALVICGGVYLATFVLDSEFIGGFRKPVSVTASKGIPEITASEEPEEEMEESASLEQ